MHTITSIFRADCICSHKYTLLAEDIISSNGFYCNSQRRPSNILVYFNLIFLRNCNFNGFSFKSLCNLARHKCKTPWEWHSAVETCKSVHYIKRYGCDIYVLVFFCCGAATQRGSWPPHSWGFLGHTQRRTTVGRTPLDEWSARRRDLYLTTHNYHNRQTSMSPVGFKPMISAGERRQTYALDR